MNQETTIINNFPDTTIAFNGQYQVINNVRHIRHFVIEYKALLALNSERNYCHP